MVMNQFAAAYTAPIPSLCRLLPSFHRQARPQWFGLGSADRRRAAAHEAERRRVVRQLSGDRDRKAQ